MAGQIIDKKTCLGTGLVLRTVFAFRTSFLDEASTIQKLKTSKLPSSLGNGAFVDSAGRATRPCFCGMNSATGWLIDHVLNTLVASCGGMCEVDVWHLQTLGSFAEALPP